MYPEPAKQAIIQSSIEAIDAGSTLKAFYQANAPAWQQAFGVELTYSGLARWIRKKRRGNDPRTQKRSLKHEIVIAVIAYCDDKKLGFEQVKGWMVPVWRMRYQLAFTDRDLRDWANVMGI